MCRLVAYAGAETTLAPLLYGGAHSLHRQSWEPRELLTGSVNADGWGMAWHDGGRARRLAEPRPVWQEEHLRGVLEGIRAPVAVAALRNATPGIPPDRSGLLPLVAGEWSFVLNGYVPDFRRAHMRALRSTLPDELYGTLRGSSDSETLFLLALAAMDGGADPGTALDEVAARVRQRVGADEAQLTLVLGGSDGVRALRTSTVARTNSLYLARGHALAPGGALLASERLDEAGSWEELPAHARVRVDADGGVEVEALEG